MASPIGMASVWRTIALQRGQALAVAEIIAPHAGHEVILLITPQRS